VRTFAVEERRARLGIRHRLSPSAKSTRPVEVADDLVGLHSSDPTTVFVSAMARLREPSIEAIEASLYDDRALLRMHAMRRTLWVFPLELAAVAQAACTAAIAIRERKRLEKLLAKSGIADGSSWFEELGDDVLAFLEGCGEAAGAELSRGVPALGTPLDYGEGRWGGMQPATSRVLFQLAAEGRIARGRPRGTWTSSQYRWAPFASWLPGGLGEWETAGAQAELARRWLGAFGPATVADLKWWTGWTLGETRRALAAIDTVEVELEGLGPGIALAEDLDPVEAPERWVALLPGLDPTTMGWKQRAWYLGELGPLLFDAAGNAGPTVWADGRIVGAWVQRKSGEVVFRLLEDVGSETTAAIEAEAARVERRLGTTRVIGRFASPLEKELAA
jgi:winged helix DNA-binding protein